MNAEHLVVACHKRATNKSLSFVHTARRYSQLRVGVKRPDGSSLGAIRKVTERRYEEGVKVVTRYL